jgi:hypothetical protein
MRKSCASTGTHHTAPTDATCTHCTAPTKATRARSASTSTSTSATASVRGVDRNRGYKRGCYHSSANVLEFGHGNLLLSFLTKDRASRRQSDG